MLEGERDWWRPGFRLRSAFVGALVRDGGEVDGEFRRIAVSLALAMLLAAASGHSPTAICTPAQASALSLSPESVSPQGSRSFLVERL